jgi:hypothetical protein
MRVQKNDIAFTPEAKQAIIDVAAIAREGMFSYRYNIYSAIQEQFVKLTANSFGIIPAGYYEMEKPENQTAIRKARLAALGADRIAKCKRFLEVVPNTSNWGLTLCEEGSHELSMLNLDEDGNDVPYRDQLSDYDLQQVLENVLGQFYDTDLLRDHNTEVKKKIKKSKYLKKVPAGDPLRAGLEESQVCYEFTDAMFDDHIDVFTDVLFIGHQLRVVKDEEGAYMVEKLAHGRWAFVNCEDKLYDIIVTLPDTLKYRERTAVEGAVRQAERGYRIFDGLFTKDEICQLADAKGIELPQESTFSVVEGRHEVIQCDKVQEGDKVVASGLKYEDAEKLRVLIRKQNDAASTLEGKQRVIKNMEEQLAVLKKDLALFKGDVESVKKNLAEHKNKIVGNALGVVCEEGEAA